MEFEDYVKPGVSSLMHFGNFFNDQSEINFLKNNFITADEHNSRILISGESGNGVTHLLNATCNLFIQHEKKAILISSRWIKQLFNDQPESGFTDGLITHLCNFDLVAIDNTEIIHSKSPVGLVFICQLIGKAAASSIKLLFGCNKPNRNPLGGITQHVHINEIKIKNINVESTLSLLKYLIEHESKISEKLVRKIVMYNGTAQQYINCLINLRYCTQNYKSTLHEGEINFNFQDFRKFFSYPQLRKCFMNEENEIMTFSDFKKEKIIE